MISLAQRQRDKRKADPPSTTFCNRCKEYRAIDPEGKFKGHQNYTKWPAAECSNSGKKAK